MALCWLRVDSCRKALPQASHLKFLSSVWVGRCLINVYWCRNSLVPVAIIHRLNTRQAHDDRSRSSEKLTDSALPNLQSFSISFEVLYEVEPRTRIILVDKAWPDARTCLQLLTHRLITINTIVIIPVDHTLLDDLTHRRKQHFSTRFIVGNKNLEYPTGVPCTWAILFQVNSSPT